MAKGNRLAIPQQVHVAKVAVKSVGTDLEGYEIPMGIGENEVAIVLASLMILRGSNELNQMWLYRKSEENIPDIAVLTTWNEEDGTWQQDPSVFDYHKYYITQATAVAYYDRVKEIYKVYPFPVVLVRDPTMLIDCGNASVSATCMLWYLLERVTDIELAQLMVKDHE